MSIPVNKAEALDVVRVTYEEFQRQMKVLIEDEIERGLYINKSEKQEYLELIKDIK